MNLQMYSIYMVNKSLEISSGYGFIKTFLYIFLLVLSQLPSCLLETIRLGVASGFCDVLLNFHTNKSILLMFVKSCFRPEISQSSVFNKKG